MAKSASDSYEEHRAKAQFHWFVGVCQQTGEPKPAEFLEPQALEGFKAALAEYRARRGTKLAPAKAGQS